MTLKSQKFNFDKNSGQTNQSGNVNGLNDKKVNQQTFNEKKNKDNLAAESTESKTENPFEQDQWFSEIVTLNPKIQTLSQKSFQKFVTKLENKSKPKSNFLADFRQNYINFVHLITKNAIGATIIMLLALTTVSASAAQLLAPNEYKPTTLANNIINPNKQPDKNPYTALKPDEKNDVVNFETCDLAIKYPKKLSNQEIKAEFAGNQSLAPQKTSPDSVNTDSLVNQNGGFTNSRTVYLMSKNEQKTLYEMSTGCETPGHIIQKTSKEEYEKLLSFEGWQKIEKTKIKEELGWFITEAQITDIYQRQVDANFIIRFLYKNQEYTFGYTVLDKNLLEQLKKNGGLYFENTEGIFGNQVQLQFNSLVKNEFNQEIKEKVQNTSSSSSISSKTEAPKLEGTKFEGKIGNSEIEMYLNINKTYIEGNYFYKSQNKTIKITQKSYDSVNGKVVLEEFVDENKTGEFEFNNKENPNFEENIKGIWTNTKTNQKLPFEVKKVSKNLLENQEKGTLETKTLTFVNQVGSGELVFTGDKKTQYNIINVDKSATPKPPTGGWLDVDNKNISYNVTGFYGTQKDGIINIEATKVEKISNQKVEEKSTNIMVMPKNAQNNLNKQIVSSKNTCESVIDGLNTYSNGNPSNYNENDKFAIFSHKNLLGKYPNAYQNVRDLVDGKRQYPAQNQGDWYDYNEAFLAYCSGFYSYKYQEAPQINLPGSDRTRVFYTLEGQGIIGNPTVRIFAYKGDNLMMLSATPISFSGLEAVGDSCGLKGDFDPGCYETKMKYPEIKKELDKAAKELISTFALE
jgi:hypothetical protein